MTDPDPHILQQIYVNDNSNDLTGNFASLIVPVVTTTSSYLQSGRLVNAQDLPVTLILVLVPVL